MHLVMFDIDGTLLQSNHFDAQCFEAALQDVLGAPIDNRWGRYLHSTDAGILAQIIDELRPSGDRQAIMAAVEERFVAYISRHLSEHAVLPIAGAPEFLRRLQSRHDVMVAIATGGWRESAQLKLAAAGIDVAGIPLASSSDHFSRMEIMKIAEARCGQVLFQRRTYFGDAAWDLRASQGLGYDFVLVGNGIDHDQAIPDYSAADEVLRRLGL